MNMHTDARALARMVPIRQLLSMLGACVRNSKRADCALCKGHSTGTVSYREHIWHCHRCQAGGDVFSLVQAVKQCDFPEALKSVADMAGVNLHDHPSNGDMRREMAVRQEERERIQRAAETLAAMERGLRRECRDRIHLAERKVTALSEQSAWTERDWLIASMAWEMLRHDLPAYFKNHRDNLWKSPEMPAILHVSRSYRTRRKCPAGARRPALRLFSLEGWQAVRFEDSHRVNAMRSQTDHSANTT